MGELFTLPVLLGILYSGIRLATPYLFAAVGETFAQRSGVLNLGVEGIMLMGAYTGFFVGMKSGNIWLGLLADIPYVGEVLFNHNLLVYAAFLLVPLSAWFLNKTTFGLKIRAVGQNPQAADTLGVNVIRVRYFCVCLGGMLAGIAGASLSIALINLFQENMTNGMGFIAVALVYFGGWRPYGVLAGALLFSFVNALQLWIQVKGINIPSDFAIMMPYVLTILALAFATKRAQQPAALTKPFERGEN